MWQAGVLTKSFEGCCYKWLLCYRACVLTFLCNDEVLLKFFPSLPRLLFYLRGECFCVWWVVLCAFAWYLWCVWSVCLRVWCVPVITLWVHCVRQDVLQDATWLSAVATRKRGRWRRQRSGPEGGESIACYTSSFFQSLVVVVVEVENT